MKLRNTTNIPTPLVRQILRFCLPEGLTLKQVRQVRITNCSHSLRGWCAGMRVCVRIGDEKHFPLRMRPYQYAQHKGRRYAIASREEALVYVMAHEVRHAWQNRATRKNSQFPAGYVRNSRGRFSEVDTEAFAIHTLRKWRLERLRAGERG